MSNSKSNEASPSPVGILYSQIGYDLGSPIRVIVRGGAGTLPDSGATWQIHSTFSPMTQGAVKHWGNLWGSDWWVADVSDAVTAPGDYTVSVHDETGAERFRTAPFPVAPDLLWERTHEAVGVGQGERRKRFARKSSGWFDAGMEWQEACSHGAYLTGFCDLLEFTGESILPTERERIEAQIINGADYLASLQDRAESVPNGAGGVVHQIWKFDDIILPGDVSKTALAWARAARHLSDKHADKKRDYRARAERAMAYLRDVAQPMGVQGFSPVAHGVPDDFAVPDEFPTRDLMMQLWAAYELAESGEPGFQEEAAQIASAILRRQIPKEAAREGLYGHFRTFDGADVSEKAWVHNNIGADTGGHFPHYLLPLLRMSESWHDHPDAPRWRQSVYDFAYGYFLPVCSANPFYLLPLGQFDGGAGVLWFAGLWHGMNAAYGLAAALAWEFERLFDDASFAPVATGNLQWIAGLNAGLTAESLHACHMYETEIAPGVAVPISMIHGIGARDAGCWLNLKGAITNGFSSGDQFKFDLAPTKENDAPSAFTDEDWISHAGGWLSALARRKSG